MHGRTVLFLAVPLVDQPLLATGMICTFTQEHPKQSTMVRLVLFRIEIWCLNFTRLISHLQRDTIVSKSSSTRMHPDWFDSSTFKHRTEVFRPRSERKVIVCPIENCMIILFFSLGEWPGSHLCRECCWLCSNRIINDK